MIQKSQKPAQQNKEHIAVVMLTILILCVALAVRLHHLDYESLFMDEIRQISYYSHSLRQIIYDAASQSQPPLDYWIGSLVSRLSFSDFAVRLPAVFFGVGTVLLLILLTSRICSYYTALVTGLIAALLPFNLYFSQDARPYSIAIFFMLAVLWSLDRFLENKVFSISRLLLLVLFATAFLYSRTLSPLVVTVTLLFILLLHTGIRAVQEGFTTNEKQGRILIACGAFIVAFMIYFPILKIILTMSGKYIDNSSFHFSITSIFQGIRKFSLLPIWQAAVVQTEPLTVPIMVLIILSPYFVWKSSLWRRSPLWINVAILLVCASFLNIFVFQIKSNMPFRPPYAIYMLPLALILAASGFDSIFEIMKKYLAPRITCYIGFIVGIVFIIIAAHSALAFKSFRKKPDWRGLVDYLIDTYDTRQILLFDSLSPYGKWEPKFYGSPRYLKKELSLIRVDQLPFYLPRIVKLPHEPIFIMFQWRKYFLTPYSKYPIFPLPSPDMKPVDYSKIGLDPLLKVKEIIGFSIIRLKESTSSLGKDTYRLIRRLLVHLPKDSSLVELHLAAAGLAKSLGLSTWQEHLLSAIALAPEENIAEVKAISAHIASH
ncbi:MAG: glycosyltransferase family 39 protein [bacterium]